MLASWLVLPLVMVVVYAGCGLAVARASGGGLARPLVLPVGLAAAVVVASSATASRVTAELAAPLVLALAVVGFAVAPDRLAWVPGRWAAAAAVGVFLAFGAPVLLSGQPTFTGYVQLDDIATWLAFTDHVMDEGRDASRLPPSTYAAVVSGYLDGGYPVGAFLPLGLGHEFTLGRDVAWLFAPTLAMMAALLALTLSHIVSSLVRRAWAQALVAFIAAQSALLYGYAEWGALKELVGALLIALVAALAPTLAGGVRRVLPLALALAALVAALSVGGGVWAAPVVLAAIAGARIPPRSLLRSVSALTVLFALLSVPSLKLALLVLGPLVKPGSVLTLETELGNLREPLLTNQLLGIWPAGDFRMVPDQDALTYVLHFGLAFAAICGLLLAVQRRAGALVGYSVGTLVGCALLASRGSPWVDGKALATASPVFLTVGLAALAWVFTHERHPRDSIRPIALATFALLAAGVLWSNVLTYANSYLAPREQLVELQSAGESLAGEGPTLMTEYEPYGARHFLRRAAAESASDLRRRVIPLRDGSQLPKSSSADVGAFEPAALREYRSLVLRTGPFASRPPSAYALLRRGESYAIWQRPVAPPAPPVADLPLGGDTAPGAVAPCAAVRDLAARAGPGGRLVAVERAAPVVVDLARAGAAGERSIPADGLPGTVAPLDDVTLTTEVEVPADGAYAVWLGGSTRGTTRVRIDGRTTGEVRGRLNNQRGAMRFGRVRLDRGTHRVELTYDDDGPAPGQRGQQSLPLPLGPLVLAPPEGALEPFPVPVSRAGELCGRRLDWIEAHAG